MSSVLHPAEAVSKVESEADLDTVSLGLVLGSSTMTNAISERRE